MHAQFENYSAGETIFFQTDIELFTKLEWYAALNDKDFVSFEGFSRDLVKKPDYPLKHTYFFPNDKRIYFVYKTEDDRKYVDELIAHLEDYQSKSKHELIAEIAIQNNLPALPSYYTPPKKKKKSKKKKSKKDSLPVAEGEENDKQGKSMPTTETPLVKSNFYNGLFLDPYWLAVCASPRLPCGNCVKNNVERLCWDCALYAALLTKTDMLFEGKDYTYRQVAIEHPWFFQQIFGSTVFSSQTRTPRVQIVVAYCVLEYVMRIIANPEQMEIGHTDVWYKRAKNDRLEAFIDMSDYEKRHPLDLTGKSMNVRFQKLEEHVFTMFKYFVKNSKHENSMRIAEYKYSECKELSFDRQPSPFNNKLSEDLFRYRVGVEDSVKVQRT